MISDYAEKGCPALRLSCATHTCYVSADPDEWHCGTEYVSRVGCMIFSLIGFTKEKHGRILVYHKVRKFNFKAPCRMVDGF